MKFKSSSKICLAAIAISLMSSAHGMGALAASTDKKIALSNNYAGNSWRQAMLKSWAVTADQALKAGLISSGDAFTTADSEVPTQAAQIQNLILQGYNAIVVDAASPEALNGAIKQACDAGIVVVAFDNVVSEPCAYKVVVDFAGQWGAEEIRQVAKLVPNGGNLLYIRGLAGTSVDADITKGVMLELAKHPNLKIVSTVNGDWDQTTAQKAVTSVLPSLPPIVAVIDQGGDGYGAAMAFASAGRKTPLIMLGNRQDELAWWKLQRQKDGYDTWSGSLSPGLSSFAFWVAEQILEGKRVPKIIPASILTVKASELDDYLAKTPVGGVATKNYSEADVLSAINAAK